MARFIHLDTAVLEDYLRDLRFDVRIAVDDIALRDRAHSAGSRAR